MRVPAIVLAAGASKRLGQPKQLVRYAGETLLERTIRAAREGGATPVMVVLGAHFEQIAVSIPRDAGIVVHNDAWKQGVSTSINAGLRALEAIDSQCGGVLLMTCDQPRVSGAHVRALLDAFGSRGGAEIVASGYAETCGVPAVFPRSLFAQLRELQGDQGARKIIADPPCRMVKVDFAGGEVDIDSPEDLAALN